MTGLTEHDIISGLRYFCIDNDYFTAGDNEQYSKMFEVAKEAVKSGLKTDIEKVAAIIWVCSETDDSIDIIGSKIAEWLSKEQVKHEIPRNEVMITVNGYFYMPTAEADNAAALEQFTKACEAIGLNGDNVVCDIVIRDSEYRDITKEQSASL